MDEEPARICVGLKWGTPNWNTSTEVVLMARWMEFYVDASGAMVPGKVSNWESVSGATDTVSCRND